MALRVGNDLVRTDAIRESIAAHGRRYLDRIYTPLELRDSAGPGHAPDAERLAARWTAKEATIKVLRPTGSDAVPWRSVELRRDLDGVAEIALHGRAATLADEQGIVALAVSVSHDGELASAVVVAEVTS